MIQWNYNAEAYQNSDLWTPPAGDHRVRIEDIEDTTSKAGNDMRIMKLKVSGYPGLIFHYLTFIPDKPDVVNKNLGAIFDSFGLRPGDLDAGHWLGKVGAARIKHENYEGEPQARVSYFLARKKQEGLPPWQEKGSSSPGGGNAPSRGGASFGSSMREDPGFARDLGETDFDKAVGQDEAQIPF